MAGWLATQVLQATEPRAAKGKQKIKGETKKTEPGEMDRKKTTPDSLPVLPLFQSSELRYPWGGGAEKSRSSQLMTYGGEEEAATNIHGGSRI